MHFAYYCACCLYVLCCFVPVNNVQCCFLPAAAKVVYNTVICCLAYGRNCKVIEQLPDLFNLCCILFYFFSEIMLQILYTVNVC